MENNYNEMQHDIQNLYDILANEGLAKQISLKMNKRDQTFGHKDFSISKLLQPI